MNVMLVDVYDLRLGDAFHGDYHAPDEDRIVLGTHNPIYTVTGLSQRTRGPVADQSFTPTDMLGVPVQYADGSHGVRHFDLDARLIIRRFDGETG